MLEILYKQLPCILDLHYHTRQAIGGKFISTQPQTNCIEKYCNALVLLPIRVIQETSKDQLKFLQKQQSPSSSYDFIQSQVVIYAQVLYQSHLTKILFVAEYLQVLL